MDTRFWGPSGWQLYHLIAYRYPENPDQATRHEYELFYSSMKDILPCRFCRESTTKFMNDLPLQPALKNRHTLTKWIYDLHNLVNHKLRLQCKEDPKVICPPPDPSFEKVTEIYEALLNVEPTVPPGLDFLFCVAYNYSKDSSEEAYSNFGRGLSKLYPYPKIRQVITQPKFGKRWYSTAKKMCAVTGFKLGTFRGTLQKYGKYKSSCNRGKTCRNGRKIRDHRKTYKITHERLVKLR
jgi:hypothetical protein